MSDEEEIELKDPTKKMVDSQEFNAIWDLISNWEIKLPGTDKEFEKANGSHVRLILDTIKDSRSNTVMEIIKKLKYKTLGNKTKDALIDRLDQMLNNTVI